MKPTLENHKRYREFDIHYCQPGCPGEISQLKVILFKSDANFRSHAVKHLANTSEESEWRKWHGSNIQKIITPAVGNLRDLGCPYFADVTKIEVPCNRRGRLCRLFDKCSPVVQEIEQAYLTCILRIIEDAGKKPRYARTKYLDSSQCGLWMLPDNSFLKFLMRWHKTYYNIVTCHYWSLDKEKWAEYRDRLIHRINTECQGAVCWCTKETWGIDGSGGKTSKDKSGKKKGTKKGSASRRYHSSGGGGNWRNYLDEWE